MGYQKAAAARPRNTGSGGGEGVAARYGEAAVEVDVAIVGLGPTGATLASLLEARGLNVLCIEKEREVHALPRAVHFDAECLRIFQTFGLAQEMLDALGTGPGTKFLNADGQVLLSKVNHPGVGAHGWREHFRCHQPEIERLLRVHLTGRKGVSLRTGFTVTGLRECEGHVLVDHVEEATGALHTVKAGYAVGCDGARSIVRKVMGSPLLSLHADQQWVVVDVLLERERPDLGDHTIQYCDPRRPATYIRGVGMRRRWELMLMPGDDAATITEPEALWRLLSPWLAPSDAALERAAVYTFHAVVAQGWWRNRLLLAGDAVHQTPPFLGQGMCSGLRDAANLAWKLADVVLGLSPPSLLATYESERAPHVRDYIKEAVRLGAVIQATDPVAAARRDASFQSGPVNLEVLRPSLGPGHHGRGPFDGRPGLQPRLDDGRLLDDEVGYRYVLVCRDPRRLAGLPDDDRLRVVAATRSVPLRQWLDQLGGEAVLVRPDRYVFGVAAEADDVAVLLANALGACGTGGARNEESELVGDIDE